MPQKETLDSPGKAMLLVKGISSLLGIRYLEDDGREERKEFLVRRLYGRGDQFLLDVLDQQAGAPRLISLSRIVSFIDLKTKEEFRNPAQFLQERLMVFPTVDGKKTYKLNFDITPSMKAIARLRYELTALVFLSHVDGRKSDSEINLMQSYVRERAGDIPYDPQKIKEYLSRLVPDEENFYESVDEILNLPTNVILLFARYFLALSMADGILKEKEREFLAELLYILKLEGIPASDIPALRQM